MGEPKAFLKYKRQPVGYRPVEERIHDFKELDLPLTPDKSLSRQDLHGLQHTILPRGRLPGESHSRFNDRYLRDVGNRRRLLHSTNNFPEITGRLCPAPCETACTLGISDEPVLIRHIEYQIVERGFEQGWIVPQRPSRKTGSRAIIDPARRVGGSSAIGAGGA
jgi:glutamate synthase (NADPH/NADH) small chain